jgi:molybdopterin synthase catalytic subunit
VEVTAPHRAEAFDACQFLIDKMKQKVPIWKKARPV